MSSHRILEQIAQELGVPHRVTSRVRRRRPGQRFSHHHSGNALDLAGPTPSQVPTPAMGAIFDAWAPYAEHLLELIYAGRRRNVKHGRWVPPYAVSLHRNHVHVAATEANARRVLELVRAARRGGSTPTPSSEANTSASEDAPARMGYAGSRGAPYPGRVIERGARGDVVGHIQERLVAHGHQLTVDRIFGRETDGRVRAFQARKGLEIDGRVGPRTWRALFSDV